jgi:hypothetical protein
MFGLTGSPVVTSDLGTVWFVPSCAIGFASSAVCLIFCLVCFCASKWMGIKRVAVLAKYGSWSKHNRRK